MGDTFITAQGFPGRKRPARSGDSKNAGIPFRTTGYGDEYNIPLFNKNHGLADEESYFTSLNPTPGTGIAGIATMTGIPTLGANTDANPYLIVVNTESDPQNGLSAYIDYLQLLATVAGTNGTRLDFAVQIDKWAVRQVKGAAVGGTLITPTNPNARSGVKSILSVWMGANTVNTSGPAGGTARLLPHRQLKTAIMANGDVYCMTFGAAEQAVGSLIQSGALVQQTFNYPPIILGPGDCALFYLWATSQSVAASFEGDLGHWER